MLLLRVLGSVEGWLTYQKDITIMSFDNHGIPDEILDGIFAEEDTERGQMKAEQNARLEDS